MTNAITLDALIRKKALAELKDEIDGDLGEVLARYFLGNTTQAVMWVPLSCECITECPDPKNPNSDGYAINIPQLFKALCKKALENVGPRRGNGAVEAFMKRVEQLDSDIKQLREGVSP